MNLSKREFLQVLGAASAAGMGLGAYAQASAQTAAQGLYDIPAFGNVSFLHMTDCHAQLKPLYFREPSVNLGIGDMRGRLPHLVGDELLKAVGVKPGTPMAHALTYLDFEQAAQRYGKVGGFAHLATLVKRLRANRPGALLVDGGDTWQGSGLALWTKGQDMVDACKLLGVDVMTGHFEFTLGMDRVKEIVEKDFAGKVDFVAQNIKTTDFGDPVFKHYAMRQINGVPCAVIGQAFPYTPIANPRWMVSEWEFGIQDEHMQKVVDEARAKGAKVVVVLSHNGMDVDLKMASRVRGIDAILGGHTHDGMPVASVVKNAGGQTLVTNAGSNGKFLGVLDLQVKDGKVADYRYKLLPVFSNMLPADPEMDALITRMRAPYEAKLSEQLAITEGLLYRRGNFNGTGDQLIVDALMDVQGADLAFSPGFRWGTTLLPGQAITREWVMDMTATTYSYATLTDMKGEMIKTVMEDVGDNLFNPDPYYQQGGDMVRVGGMTYDFNPLETMGKRVSNMRLKGELIDPNKTYKVAGWAPVSEEAAKAGNPMVWDLVEQWLKARGGKVATRQPNMPRLTGAVPNPGMAG
ncbi:thiosulfohydrolase SoxB [Melaminivora suipulveris]|uniref:Thiosulfohydrolase SoxB n=1 Tax=Melaminivora suipulveris TaxID=2109913 RepID=A0A2R3QC48_9BURK|nr:thiosulfohydrolase SoxB [Melaminivora suipulveris]AVO49349.1 thiosulfohydrolase SoxB [Melaminivora suipulveris]